MIKAISDEGSFTAAAAVLGLTQPAVSQMVRRLEQRTGTALVEKAGRSVRLTEAGQVLARYAESVLSAIEAAEDEVSAIAGLRAGRVRLMAFPSSSASLVPRALVKLRERHPGVQVSFVEAEPRESITALRNGDCDVVVAFSYAGMPPTREEELDGLVVYKLMDEDMKVALPPTHPLATTDVVDLKDLAEDPWIAGCPKCRGHLVQMAHKAGFSPDVAFETEDYTAVLGFVSQGLGVALLPDLILREASNPNVVPVATKQESTRSIHVVSTPDLERVPAVKAAIAALIDAAADAGWRIDESDPDSNETEQPVPAT